MAPSNIHISRNTVFIEILFLFSIVIWRVKKIRPSVAYLSCRQTAADLNAPELYFPLRLFTCSSCYLVQVDEVQKHDALFSSDYVYFSSYSRTWLAHAENYVQLAVERLGLNQHSLVMEVASNDGYLLQYVKARGIPCVGVEPTASTAAAARERGIESVERFFEGRSVDVACLTGAQETARLTGAQEEDDRSAVARKEDPAHGPSEQHVGCESAQRT